MESRKRVFAQVTLESINPKNWPAREIGPLEVIDMKMKLKDTYDALELEVVDIEEAEAGLVTVVYAGKEVTIPRQCVILVLRHERVYLSNLKVET